MGWAHLIFVAFVTIQYIHTEVIDILIKAGVDVNARIMRDGHRFILQLHKKPDCSPCLGLEGFNERRPIGW